MTAARNIMGEPYEFDFSEYPDFLHTTYEVTWVGLTEAEADARIDAQLPLEKKIAVADHVIENDGDLDALRERTEAVHRALVARFAEAASKGASR